MISFVLFNLFQYFLLAHSRILSLTDFLELLFFELQSVWPVILFSVSEKRIIEFGVVSENLVVRAGSIVEVFCVGLQ